MTRGNAGSGSGAEILECEHGDCYVCTPLSVLELKEEVTA